MEDQRTETTHLPDEHTEQPKAEQKHVDRGDRWLEAITAIMLGIVAVATAWSGYQAARWDGLQASLYSQASALRVESTRDSTLAGQDRLYDISVFDGWLTAQSEGNAALARIYVKRFRGEFFPVFSAWLATDPFHNPDAPPGPTFMPQYQLSQAIQADRLNAQAGRVFQRGEAANQQSDDYTLNTVFLAVVLFLTAFAERFEWRVVRVAILVVAAILLAFGLYHLVVYPIA